MPEKFAKLKAGFLLFPLLIMACSFCWAKERPGKAVPHNTADGLWDPHKYISVDEIRPQMEAYCLTTYKGAEIEKFGLEVLSVVRNIEPGRDAILVQGTDERFIHSGPVWGCSGSPVYIDGRLAGALAFAMYFSKDPLYGVTPIKDTLSVGSRRDIMRKPGTASAAGDRWEPAFRFDFSRPIDFSEIKKQVTTSRLTSKNLYGGLSILPCPVITSGLPAEVCEKLNVSIEPFGLVAVAGGGTSSAAKDIWRPENVQLAPGACLAVPVVSGDITMTVIGTVTEVAGDKVYGLGHGFLGSGAIDLPMATGQVHTVVSSVIRSFKFASPIEIVGALTTDESAGVCGKIGAKAKMIPLTITVDRYNDSEIRKYNCSVADNQMLTPVVLSAVVAGAALTMGDLPPDHAVEYKAVIGLDGAAPVAFENVSTGTELEEMLEECVAAVTILLNNPYKKVNIKSIDFNVRIVPRNISSRIWSVDLSGSRIKAGRKLDVAVVVESYLAEKKKYRYSLNIPSEVAPGKYDLIICGGYGYQEFLIKTAPYKFIPQNFETLVEAMNNLLTIGRDKLYCLLVLPAGGVAIEKAELPDLPATKVLLLQDPKRAFRSQPHPNWLEESSATGTVIIDERVMQVIVEEQ
ncbi:MAG: hypothetical protein JW947_10045 [Sedimentisphaerales bacterium]|nr:hypothetical protein [Sedimentisphaerales bacterium]